MAVHKRGCLWFWHCDHQLARGKGGGGAGQVKGVEVMGVILLRWHEGAVITS